MPGAGPALRRGVRRHPRHLPPVLPGDASPQHPAGAGAAGPRGRPRLPLSSRLRDRAGGCRRGVQYRGCAGTRCSGHSRLALVVGLCRRPRPVPAPGRIFAGFWVMENLLVAVGGPGARDLPAVRRRPGHERQVVRSGRDIQAMIESRIRGAVPLHRLPAGELVETDVPTGSTRGATSSGSWWRSLPAMLQLASALSCS
jgi:hypothetical protein